MGLDQYALKVKNKAVINRFKYDYLHGEGVLLLEKK